MRTLLIALSLLAAFSAITVAAPSAGAFSDCTQLTTPNCDYLLCIGASQNQYGYYTCQYPIYWPCQYCVPLA